MVMNRQAASGLLFQITYISLSFIFILSAISKVFFFTQFSQTFIPIVKADIFASLLTAAIIASELLLGYYLLTSQGGKYYALFALVMLLSYTVIASVLNALGLLYDCKCFGALFTGTIGASFYIRNLILLGMSMYIFNASIKGTISSNVPSNRRLSYCVKILNVLLVFALGWLISGIVMVR